MQLGRLRMGTTEQRPYRRIVRGREKRSVGRERVGARAGSAADPRLCLSGQSWGEAVRDSEAIALAFRIAPSTVELTWSVHRALDCVEMHSGSNRHTRPRTLTSPMQAAA